MYWTKHVTAQSGDPLNLVVKKWNACSVLPGISVKVAMPAAVAAKVHSGIIPEKMYFVVHCVMINFDSAQLKSFCQSTPHCDSCYGVLLGSVTVYQVSCNSCYGTH